MAKNPSRTSSGRGASIDLTTINDDDEDYVATNLSRPHNSPQERRKRRCSSPNSRSRINASNAPTSTHAESRLLSSSPRNPREADNHPSKRQKLSNGTAHKAVSPIPDTEALTKCLQTQVFPHLDAAVRELDKNVFNVEKLGGKVISTIADDDFQLHFHKGNGRLPPNMESSIIGRIYKLVAEFTAGNEFRHRPTTRAISQSALVPAKGTIAKSIPSILPSIEKPPSELASNNNVEDDSDESYDDDASCSDDAYLCETEEKLNDIIEQVLQEIQKHLQTQPRKKQLASPRHLRPRSKITHPSKSREPKGKDSPADVNNRWSNLSDIPYQASKFRGKVRYGLSHGCHIKLHSCDLRHPTVYHVDFYDLETKYLRYVARSLCNRGSTKAKRSDTKDLRHLMKKFEELRTLILEAHRRRYDQFDPPPWLLLQRSAESLQNFLNDVLHKQVNLEPVLLTFARDERNSKNAHIIKRANVVPLSLYAREMADNRLGGLRVYHSYTTTFTSNREDFLEPKVEWTNCAGDIMTISWLPDATRFVCGATTHSDSHNQQYNKPGNLLFGDASLKTLRAYPDHRIPRPLVAHGENALEAMRESQDPWLFTSVVSSDYDPVFDFAFTSSFDNTVKVWHTTEGAIALRETWHHEGHVNFVVTNKSKHGSKVATATDVPTRAVRVYYAQRGRSGNYLQAYRYKEFSCKRVHGEDYVPSDKWAYFPSAIRWGIDSSVNHLLLIGYSPRSLNNDDSEIPEEKRSTGELCLWDMNTYTEVKVNSAATSNVFEVVWHPYRPCFAAATSASQTSEKLEEHIRTQIRIFELNEVSGQYGVVKTLDCPAIDINELAIRPNSVLYSYVAAGCTDGKAYVWDSAASEGQPMCVLEHGDPVEEVIGNREQEDVGVKFIAWATSPDRLYTGSSDGFVKVWNIRQGKGELVRDLIEVAAPITAGAFSPDFTKLLIGDGSGRVYLMDMEDDEENNGQNNPAATSLRVVNMQVNGKQRAIRRPRPFIPHPEVPPPNQDGGDEFPNQPRYQLGQRRAREYLETSHLTLHPDPTIGAVQGPAYPETGLYRAEAHLNGDPQAPLLSGFESLQRANQFFSRTTRFRRQGSVDDMAWDLQAQNAAVDADIEEMLDPDTRSALEAEGAELGEALVELEYEDEDGECGYDADEE
ncbi:WD40 repeat-like protein [Daldinia decipiens]|uniref:WD40 repeat-like protein n=1 Tax=Daldinia decipiens TaxID=326647 RepID=UPI0020C57AFD|nr:WD40 repeat-like protein [Daldinia decipiens]KAI1656171.1 WD40 repeat-like protein [Daldinia decipiens]